MRNVINPNNAIFIRKRSFLRDAHEPETQYKHASWKFTPLSARSGWASSITFPDRRSASFLAMAQVALCKLSGGERIAKRKSHGTGTLGRMGRIWKAQ